MTMTAANTLDIDIFYFKVSARSTLPAVSITADDIFYLNRAVSVTVASGRGGRGVPRVHTNARRRNTPPTSIATSLTRRAVRTILISVETIPAASTGLHVARGDQHVKTVARQGPSRYENSVRVDVAVGSSFGAIEHYWSC
jgi:hypothetical protein